VSTGAQVDYDALAQQHGGSAAVDYDALAAQHGGASPTTSPQPQGLWDRVKSFFSDSSLSNEARANYEKAHGKLDMPGSTEGAALMSNLAEWDKASGGELGGGVHDIIKGNVAKGIHRIISGAGAATAPVAALAGPTAVARAPITTALSVGGGILGGKAAGGAARMAGASPDQAQLVEDVGSFAGGYLGAGAPSLAKKGLLLGRTPEEAYQSALKPSTTLAPQRVESAVQTGLSEAIPVSKGGAEKIQRLLEDLHDKVSSEIGAGSGKTVNPYAVTSRLSGTTKRFANQVNPNADLNAISEAGNEFLANNPKPIPAAQAQQMKVGTYQQLRGKYGQLSGATIEAQKALARGIKEELATQFPELSSLNAKESDLYNLEPLLEKAVNRIGNHQLLGIGTPVAAGAARAVTGSEGIGATAGIMKAVLDNPNIKSRLAIALWKAGGTSFPAAQARVLAFSNALGAAAASSPSDTSEGQSSRKTE